MSTRSSSPPEGSVASPISKPKTLFSAEGSDAEDSSLPFKSPKLSQSGEDLESSEDEIIRPRGRFAAQMLGSLQAPSENTAQAKPAPESAPESARDRVRRLLGIDAPRSPSEVTQDQKGATGTRSYVDASADDDDDLPTTPQRRRRPERQPTPDLEGSAPPSSPGLFVSPGQKSAVSDDMEDDAALPKPKNPRFQALVDRKRREREEREAEEEAKRAARATNYHDDDSSGVTDDDAGRKMTQEGRTKRKAGKKAIEEMNRETQRMARSMQLAHQAMTKKKITKATLFEKFNFKQAGAATETNQASSSRPTTPLSDTEMKDSATPPSSPPPRSAEKVDRDVPEDNFLPVDQLPPSSPRSRASRAKGVAAELSTNAPATETKPAKVQPKRRVRVKLPPPTTNLSTIDSDDELAITTKNSKLDALFDKVPRKKKDSGALHAFKCLAQLTSPGKAPHSRREKPGMTAAEMQSMLRARAREQARVEKEKRIEMLKAKGVVIQTEEERRKEMEEVEDIVARAREEAEEIMQREREEAKKAKKEQDGEADPLGWDDSEDDGDYQASGDEGDDEDEREIVLSGSEDEDEADGSEDEAPNPLFENEADEDGSDASDVEKVAETTAVDEPKSTQAEDDDAITPLPRARRTKNTRVLSDDEDEDDDVVKATPRPKSALFKSPDVDTDSPAAPTSVLRSATKTFIPGFPIAPANPAGLGLTQMFAGTMADSQMGTSPTQSMNTPKPTFDPFAQPTMDSQDMDDDDVVMDSQPEQETQRVSQGVDLHYSQTQMRGLDSLLQEDSTQLSDFQLTQDQGLVEHTPMRERFIDAPGSTISTVQASGSTQMVHETPLARKGRLRRKMDVIPATPADEDNEASRESPERDEFGFNTTAFGVMKKAAKEERAKKQEFDRKKSKAVGMIEEQAEESEDEYAGLGGVDDDDASDGDLESVKDLIDDEKKGNTAEEERNLAAFYADRERADAERDVERLFKDITTGALRRKRANDYDLSDSDDGGEARKRRKRMQFAKMQKALFADERVKKMSENPGNQAFLRTLEDNASGDELDIIDIEEPESSQSQSQSQSQAPAQQKEDVVVPDSQPAANRAPAHQRRTKNGRKPGNISDVRESLSSLLDEPSVIAPTEFGSDSEDEGGDKENVSPRRRGPVRDRIAMKRASTSESSNGGRRAFAGSSQGFRAPTLLRRATSSSLASNLTASSGDGKKKADSMFGEKIKKGAGRGTGVVAGERRAVAKESAGDARRRERRMKGAEDRLKAARGLFGGVAFE